MIKALLEDEHGEPTNVYMCVRVCVLHEKPLISYHKGKVLELEERRVKLFYLPPQLCVTTGEWTDAVKM